MPTPDALSGLLIDFLSKSIAESETGKKAKSELIEATWNWLRPLFLKDDKDLAELKEKLLDPQIQYKAKESITKSLQDSEKLRSELSELVTKIQTEQVKELGLNVEMKGGKNNAVIGTNTGTISFN